MTKDKTVFVVDDDDAAAASVAALMTAVGIPCKVFNSAENFLESFDGSQSGCLILDIRLSGMSGLDLYATLRDRGLEIPTILVSGHADSDSCRQAMRDGALAYLEKPYAGQQLFDYVQSAFDGQSPG